jgi:hypothetical protein
MIYPRNHLVTGSAEIVTSAGHYCLYVQLLVSTNHIKANMSYLPQSITESLTIEVDFMYHWRWMVAVGGCSINFAVMSRPRQLDVKLGQSSASGVVNASVLPLLSAASY